MVTPNQIRYYIQLPIGGVVVATALLVYQCNKTYTASVQGGTFSEHETSDDAD